MFFKCFFKTLFCCNFVKRGVITVVCGDGKTKTSNCLGVFYRLLLYGVKCYYVCFIKGVWFSSDRKVVIVAAKCGFDINAKMSFVKELGRCLCYLIAIFGNPDCYYVILDEMSLFYKLGFPINLKLLLAYKPIFQSLIITGKRNLLITKSCTKIRMISVQHHSNFCVMSQLGIEY